MVKKKREFIASDLMKTFAKIHGFENKLKAFELKKFLESYLDKDLLEEVQSINIQDKTVVLKINSSMLKNDFRMRKTFYLKKFQEILGEEVITSIKVF